MDRWDILQGHYCFYFNFNTGTSYDYYKRLKRIEKHLVPRNRATSYTSLTDDGCTVFDELAVKHYEKKLKESKHFGKLGIPLKDVFQRLRSIWRDITYYIDPTDEEAEGIDIRIRVYPGMRKYYYWEIKTGDPQYDTDLRGLWRTTYLSIEHTGGNVVNAAFELLDDVLSALADRE